jgi:hypothetical protein
VLSERRAKCFCWLCESLRNVSSVSSFLSLVLDMVQNVCFEATEIRHLGDLEFQMRTAASNDRATDVVLAHFWGSDSAIPGFGKANWTTSRYLIEDKPMSFDLSYRFRKSTVTLRSDSCYRYNIVCLFGYGSSLFSTGCHRGLCGHMSILLMLTG